MRSHVLDGTVRHRRARPFVYALEHRVHYLALDLDELDDVVRSSRLIGRESAQRPGTARRRSHGSAGRCAACGVPRSSAVAEVDPTGWQITLVTNPRILGYVFNPASFYLCRDGAGELRVVVVEVHNTHGERRLYTLRPRHGVPTFIASMEKAFYVSPFIETGGGYIVRIRDEASRLRITINHGCPMASSCTPAWTWSDVP